MPSTTSLCRSSTRRSSGARASPSTATRRRTGTRSWRGRSTSRSTICLTGTRWCSSSTRTARSPSRAWRGPGFVGVVTGMNAEGVLVVVHGARGGTTVARRDPRRLRPPRGARSARTTPPRRSTSSARRTSWCRTSSSSPTAAGRFAVVERAPGVPAFVRDAKSHGTIAVTNHFEGPLADDPKNLRVRANTSTVARRARIDELLAGVAPHTVIAADGARHAARSRMRRTASPAPWATADRSTPSSRPTASSPTRPTVSCG